MLDVKHSTLQNPVVEALLWSDVKSATVRWRAAIAWVGGREWVEKGVS